MFVEAVLVAFVQYLQRTNDMTAREASNVAQIINVSQSRSTRGLLMETGKIAQVVVQHPFARGQDPPHDAAFKRRFDLAST